jgi:hypothetical protein
MSGEGLKAGQTQLADKRRRKIGYGGREAK